MQKGSKRSSKGRRSPKDKGVRRKKAGVPQKNSIRMIGARRSKRASEEDLVQLPTPRDLQFLDQSLRPSDVALKSQIVDMDLSVAEIDELLKLLVMKKQRISSSKGDDFRANLLAKQKRKLEELRYLQNLYQDSLNTERLDKTSGNDVYVELQSIKESLDGSLDESEEEARLSARCDAPHDKMFMSGFENTSETGQCSQEQGRDAQGSPTATTTTTMSTKKSSSSYVRSRASSKKLTRAVSESPGGIRFRRSPQPDVPPLNLGVINVNDPQPLTSAWPTDNAMSSGPKRILHSAPADTVIYSPRAKACMSALSDRAKSPDISKCVESILSPRSAFSRTSRSTESTSAFSTPSTTPRSSRGLTPRKSYALATRSGRGR
eukprot:g1049.t1